MDNINNIFLRDNVIKICDIRPCGCNIPLSTIHVSGYKNILARLTISDIRKLLASGIRVCEYTKRDEKNNLDGLQVINTNNFNRVVSMEHVRLLKSINRGYIDIANSIFAGTVTPAPENKKEDVITPPEAETVAPEKESPSVPEPETEPAKEIVVEEPVDVETSENTEVDTSEESETSSIEESEDAPADTQTQQNNKRRRKNNRH
jgi:hypothetical protein